MTNTLAAGTKLLLTPMAGCIREGPLYQRGGQGHAEHEGSTCSAHPPASIPGPGGLTWTPPVRVQHHTVVDGEGLQDQTGTPLTSGTRLTRSQTYLWIPSTKATSSGEDDMYTQDFPESGDFLGPSTSSSSFTWMVWHRQRARKNSSSRSYKNAVQKSTHLWTSA